MNAIAVPETSATQPDPNAAVSEAEISRNIVDGLKDLACDVLGRGIERMFDGADDMLFEMARRASTNKDQRIYFDTMRVVRLGRPKIGRSFREEIAAGFSPRLQVVGKRNDDLLTYENLSLQESRSLEESIAVSSMATKAEHLYSNALFELGRRLDWMIQEKNAPLDRQALAPATISDAFRRCAEAMDVEFDIELIIFKLFDRLVISDLGELYSRALQFLDQSGVRAAPIGNVSSSAPRRPYGGGPDGAGRNEAARGSGSAAAPGHYDFSRPPMMDPTTLSALRALSGSGVLTTTGGLPAAYYGPGDMQLSADLATAASGQIVPGWEKPRAYAYVQRAGAVGQMFNELMQDPTLPAALKPRFEQLRFSVIKSALHDSSFFADAQHPVRGLMNDLTTLAASARASGMDALRRIEELVGQIQRQFDVAAEDVRAQTALPDAVDDSTLEQFFEQQKEEARQRRVSIIERTRRVVAEELQLATLSRHLPDQVWPLLNSAWAPLAALRLLKQGADSEGWREGMTLLQRVLDTVDPGKPSARTAGTLTALDNELRSRLAEIGMLETRISLLVQAWREGVDAVDAALVTPAAAAPMPTQPAAEKTPSDSATRLDAASLPIDPVEDSVTATEPAAESSSARLERQEEVGDTTEPSGFSEPGTETVPEATAPESAAAADERVLPVATDVPANSKPAAPDDPIALLDLLMVLSSWFRVYDHERSQNRWLKVIAHHPADGSVTFAEFNGQNRLQMRTQVFLDDLVAGRAEPIDLGPAARRSLEAYLQTRRAAAETAAPPSA